MGLARIRTTMKKLLIATLLLASSSSAFARDDVNDYSVKEAMEIPKVSNAIGGGVEFYFGNQPHAKVLTKLGQFQSNKKTSAFGKTDEAACQWAFASAMKSLRKRAIKEGGNAVINIKSNYKGTLTSSDTTFKCGAGNVIAGVALIGDVVKLAR